MRAGGACDCLFVLGRVETHQVQHRQVDEALHEVQAHQQADAVADDDGLVVDGLPRLRGAARRLALRVRPAQAWGRGAARGRYASSAWRRGTHALRLNQQLLRVHGAVSSSSLDASFLF